MATFATFDQEIRMATAGISPAAVNRALADFARSELRKAQSVGTASRSYRLYVNDRPASSEYEVEAPGPILYLFSMWAEIIDFAIAELNRCSPVRSGRFRAAMCPATMMIAGNWLFAMTKLPIGPTQEADYTTRRSTGLMGQRCASM